MLDQFTRRIIGFAVQKKNPIKRFGQIWISVGDLGRETNATGAYEIFFVRVPGADENEALPNGSSVSDSISLGDIDSCTFDASLGETVHLNVGDLDNTPFGPIVSVYGPSRDLVGYGNRQPIEFSVPETGIYTLVLEDNWVFSAETGSYDLYYAKAPGANEGGTLVNGDRVSGRIDLGDIDSYTFEAFATQAITLTINDLSDEKFGPRVSVYGPTGTAAGFTEQNILTLIAQETGLYTVLVQDNQSFSARTGEYDLQLTSNAFCTPDQTSAIATAEAAARVMILESIAALESVSSSERESAQR